MRRAGVPEQLQEDVPPGAVLVFAEVVEQAVGFVGSEASRRSTLARVWWLAGRFSR